MLDGRDVGRVKRGASLELTTTAGPHELHLAIDWTRSEKVTLDLGDGEELEARCWPNASPFTALYWITFGRSRYIGLEVVAAEGC